MKITKTLQALSIILIITTFSSCGGGGSFTAGKPGNLGPQPDPQVRKAQIANEARGNFYYGRRYHVNKTRFWGYLRKPGQPWSKSKLVIMNEDSKRQPDRFSENGSGDKRFAFDQNYEYKIYGNYLSQGGYDPNSNQFLPQFRLTGYQLMNKNPGWIVGPDDYYDPNKLTIRKH